MKNILKFAALTLLCASCASEMPQLPIDTQPVSPKSNLEYALEHVEKMMGQLDPATRGTRCQPNVQFVCGETTRSGKQDTLLYLVNYADNMGFALLDAEAKNGGIYAISPTGHMEFSDSIDNPSLAYFFRKVKEVSAIKEPLTRDVVIIGWKNPNFYINEHVGPLLSEWIASWSGEKIPGIGPYGAPDKATTAAVAVAKMLTRYKPTAPICGYTIDWNEIIYQENLDWVKNLIFLLNHPQFINDVEMDKFGNIGAGDENRKVTPLLVQSMFSNIDFPIPSIKYTDPISSSDVQDKIKQTLRGIPANSPTNNGEPLIGTAHPKSTDGFVQPYYQFWIVDGFVDRISKVQLPGEAHLPILYHILWGKDGYIDGYYMLNNNIDNSNVDPKTGYTYKHAGQMTFPSPSMIGGYNYVNYF